MGETAGKGGAPMTQLVLERNFDPPLTRDDVVTIAR